ncbi:MAG: Gldg family protein [Planctomycetes bacterium]|nr:Gldg family protein [Planctomycetota bacterium]
MKWKSLGLWVNLLVGGALALAIWVLMAWVASRPALRTLVDLTPQQSSSVDAITIDLLKELRGRQADLEFHQFYPPFEGQAADALKAQEFRIRSRLRELTKLLLLSYQALGGDQVKVIEHDLYGDPQKTREAAQRFDYRDSAGDVLVVAVRVPGKEPRFRKLSLPLDLGRIEMPNTAAPMAKNQLPVLKAFVGEVQISSAIKSLLVEGTPAVYVLMGFSPQLSDGATGGSYGMLFGALQKLGFDVKRWDASKDAAVPADAALVVALEPVRDFNDKVTESLHTWVKRGGRVFVNYAWNELDDWNPTGGKFGQLLGYEVGARPVFHKIRDTSGKTGGRWLDNDPAVKRPELGVNPGHPITRRLAQSRTGLEVRHARAIREIGSPAGVRRDVLLVTGDQGWQAAFPEGQQDYRAPLNVKLASFDVGMAIEVDVDPALLPPDTPNPPKTGHVVLVAGQFCTNEGMPYYGDLALNICNWLTERKVLLDLKSSGYEAKYLQVQPPQIDRIGFFLVYGVPGLFLLLGGVVLYLRRRQ